MGRDGKPITPKKKKVLKKKDPKELEIAVRMEMPPDYTITFEVLQAWKGVESKTVDVNVGSGVCCICTFGPRPF